MSTYDQIPYLSDPSPSSHPDRLFTVARLLGMSPLPSRPGESRILELGCGSGPSTIPMAISLREAEIVAVDASRFQVEKARRRAELLKLRNLTISQIDLREFPEDAGQFDYIIAHGIYSWIPSDCRDALMTICQRHLKPAGVAFLSYNVNPGWQLRQPVRQLLEFHSRDITDPTVVVQRSQELFARVLQYLPDSLRAYRGLLESLRENVLNPDRGGSYLIHDLLGEGMTPVLFSEFMGHAAAHDLRFLAEADFDNTRSLKLGADLQREIGNWTTDVIAAEQYVDLLTGRAFRKSLLCRASVKSDQKIAADRFRDLYVAGNLDCGHPKRQLTSTEKLDFQGANDGIKGSTGHPLTKAVMLTICESWPQPIWLDDLLATAAKRLGDSAERAMHASDADRREVTTCLAQMLATGILRVFSDAPQFQTTVSQFPQAADLARLQAVEGEKICNLLQHPIDADDFQRALLPLLDGTRSRNKLLEDWTSVVLERDLTIGGVHATKVARQQVVSTLSRRLDDDLDVMARAALLVG